MKIPYLYSKLYIKTDYMYLLTMFRGRFIFTNTVIKTKVYILFYTATPGAPSLVKVTKTGKDFVDLEWSKPKSDGNSKITNYHIRMANGQPDNWTDVAKVNSYDTHFTVKDLDEGVDYYFAVAAENEAGIGKQVETDQSVKPSKPKGIY